MSSWRGQVDRPQDSFRPKNLVIRTFEACMIGGLATTLSSLSTTLTLIHLSQVASSLFVEHAKPALAIPTPRYPHGSSLVSFRPLLKCHLCGGPVGTVRWQLTLYPFLCVCVRMW